MKESEIWYRYIHIVGKLFDLFDETFNTYDCDWMRYVDDYWKNRHRYEDDVKRLWDERNQIFSEFVDLVTSVRKDGTLERINKEWQELERERRKEDAEES